MAELADSIVEDDVKLEEPNIEDVITETADELEQLFADSYLTTEELFNSDPLAKQAANFAIARGVSPSAGWLWKLGGVDHPVEEVKLESGYTWIIGDYDTFDDDIFLSPEGLEYTFDELTKIAQGDDTLSEDIAGITGEGTTEEQQTSNIIAGFQYLFPDEDPYSQLEYYFGSEDEDVLNERVEEFYDVMEQAGRTKETESLVKSLWSDITDAQMAYIFGEDYLQIAIGESNKAFQDKLSSIASSYNLPQGAIDSYINALKEYETAKTYGVSAMGSVKLIQAKKDLEKIFGKDYENSELYKELSAAYGDYWENYGKFEGASAFKRSLVAGIGDIISGVGGAAGWVGLDSVSEYFNEEAERLQNVAPLVEDVEWTWDNAFTGNFWRSVGLNVARAIPFSVALLPLGLVGFGVGVGIATALRIASPILRGVFGAATGGIMSGLAESALEAGGVYNEAIAQGMTEDESSQAAATAFRNNAALLSLTNAAELFIGLKVANPTKTLNSVIKRGLVTVSKAGRVALTEAGQEVFQEVIQKNALGEEIDWTSDDMKMVALVGGIMGGGMGTSLDLVSGIVNRTVNNLPERQKAQFEEIKASLPEDMPEAEKNVKALEEIADDKTVQKILETVSALSKIDAYQEMVKPKNEAEQIAWDKTFDKQRQDVIDKSGMEIEEEARQYSTAEEFVAAQFNKKPEYGMSHRPTWEEMPPASNLLEGGIIPDDVYTHPEYSIASGRSLKTDKAARESWKVLQDIRNKPDAIITVYRATRKNELNTGDWVTLSEEYASNSIDPTSNEKVYSFQVKAKDVILAGDDINEFGYYPREKLTQIWNKSQQPTMAKGTSVQGAMEQTAKEEIPQPENTPIVYTDIAGSKSKALPSKIMEYGGVILGQRDITLGMGKVSDVYAFVNGEWRRLQGDTKLYKNNIKDLVDKAKSKFKDELVEQPQVSQEKGATKSPQAGNLPSKTSTAQALAGAIPNTIKAGAPLDVIRRSEIAKKLSEQLNVPIRRGKFREKASGIYKQGKEIIRIKSGNIATIAHEIGHLIDERYNLSKDISLKEMNALLQEYPDPKNKHQEAFGEFLRYYITQPLKAKDLAPKFTSVFDNFLEDNQDVKEAILTAKDDYNRWTQLPSTAKVASQINTDPPQTDKTLKQTLNNIYTSAWDSLYPIRDFVKKAEKQGIKLEAAEDPYILARLLKGVVGRANTFMETGTFGRDLFTQKGGKYKGKSLRQVLEPVSDNLDNLRIYLVSRRTVELSGRGIETGINPNDAKQSVAELESQYPNFNAVAEELYTYQRELLEYVEESGLISKDTLKKLAAKSKDYVPFYRVMEELQSNGHMGKGFTNIRDGIKKIRGSEREIVDPLESIVKNTYALIDAADRNQVGIALANLAEKDKVLYQMFEKVPNPMAKVAEVTAKDLGISLDGLTEEETERVFNVFRPSMFNPKDNVVSVVMDGKKSFYQVDPELYKAITAIEREDVNIMIRLLAYPAKWLRAGAVLNPDFWLLKNPVRDTLSAFVYSKYGFIPIVDTIRGTFEYLKKGEMYNLWRASGGERSMLVSLDREYLQKSFSEVLKGKPKVEYLKHPLEALQIFAEFTESGTRIGEFMRGVRKGATPIQSGFDSREVTLDFAVMGAKTRSWNMITAFFNSNMRGVDKLVREATQRPLNFAPKIILGIMLPSILLYLVNKDDERYKEIPQWERDLFWIFFVGDQILRIPKPFEVGILFGSIPERIMEYIDNRDPDVLKESLSNLLSSMNPGIVPTGLSPLLENMANYSFFLQRNIVPDSEEGLPYELQYSIYTPEIIKKFGDWLNYSPRKIENLLSGYTAGLGDYTIKTLDGLLKNTGILPDPIIPTPELKDYPVIGALIARNPYGSGSTSVNSFYNKLGELEGYESALKSYIEQENEAKYNEYMTAHPETMFMFDYDTGSYYSASARYLRRVSRDLADLRKKQEEIYLSNDLTSDEKRQLINEIDVLVTDTARLAVEYLETMPNEFSEDGSSPLKEMRTSYFDYVGELPAYLRDYYNESKIDIDEGTASKYLQAITKQKESDIPLTERYYTDTQGAKSSVKYKYREDNPEIDAALNFWGYVTTLRSDEARRQLEKMADKYGIPYDAFPALAKSVSDKSTPTLPTGITDILK